MKRISELSDEEKRVLVAQACGVTQQFAVEKAGAYYREGGHGYTLCLSSAGRYSEEAARRELVRGEPMQIIALPLPDYFASLDACALMEDTLTDSERALYACILSWESVEEIYDWLEGEEFDRLRFSCGGLPAADSWIELPSLEAFKNLVHRPASQRVDSYLLAKGLALP